MLSAIICQLAGHRVNRRRVWHDQVDFRTRCERCGTDLIRGRHGWRLFDAEQDAEPHRRAGPRAG